MTAPRTAHDAGKLCQCSADHRPAPLELAAHRLLPGEHGGTYTDNNVVWLCPTTHVNVHELLRLLLASDPPLTETRVRDLYPQPVSRYAYRIAAEGLRRIGEAA